MFRIMGLFLLLTMTVGLFTSIVGGVRYYNRVQYPCVMTRVATRLFCSPLADANGYSLTGGIYTRKNDTMERERYVDVTCYDGDRDCAYCRGVYVVGRMLQCCTMGRWIGVGDGRCGQDMEILFGFGVFFLAVFVVGLLISVGCYYRYKLWEQQEELDKLLG